VLFVAVCTEGDASRDLAVAAFVRGDRDVNEVKLGNAVTRAGHALLGLRPMHPDEVRAATGAEPGFAGPGEGLNADLIILDEQLRDAGPLIAGANRTDHHLVGFVISRDARAGHHWADLASAIAGDACLVNGLPLQEKRGIEVGHVFKLGTKYSVAMSAQYLGPDQKLHPFIMGCYGIGSSRVVAAAVEQHHDAEGLRWPVSIAPWHAVVVPAQGKSDECKTAAAKLYEGLTAAGVETVLDDRDLGPGVKFKDWDLLGLPFQIVVGRALAEGKVEIKERATMARREVAIDSVVAEIAAAVRAGGG
jgi:prolyl-tRNA synthetase